jgi:hypothetical protein
MPVLRRIAVQGLSLALLLSIGSMPAHADDWLPISPQDLSMTSEPKAPAAAAIYLYRQVDRDDNGPSEVDYRRIKILTDEGREYANIEIQYDGESESIRGIQARTIHPDGSIVSFDGQTFDKPIVTGSGVKLMAKTFTLPDVRVGSVIEYRYRHLLRSGYVYNSQWILSQDLFTRDAKFLLAAYHGVPMRYSWPFGLPPDTAPPTTRGTKIVLETHNVPAFITEEFMPPQNELKYRVNFIYEFGDDHAEKDSDAFWQKYAKRKYRAIEKFVDRSHVMTEALSHFIQPSDIPSVKVQKIYARVQQIRNLSYEREKSEQEADRDKIKKRDDVEDIWKYQYGDGDDITWLFLALVRAAGVEAYPLLVPTRNNHFFSARLMNPGDLNTNAVVVMLDGKEVYLDPGSRFAPYGLLPWNETAVMALRLEKGGGTWVQTPLPDPKESRIERKAILELTETGALQGKVTVTYTGQEALWRRLEERYEDETQRKQFLEDQLQADVPTGIEAELSNSPDWDGSSAALVAVYDFKANGWAMRAGQKTLLPMGLFGARHKNAFQHATRVHPIYFRYSYEESDDLAIELAPHWKAISVPQPRRNDITAFNYTRSVDAADGVMQLHRELTLNASLVAAKYYPAVRGFFESVRAGDDEQAVLGPLKGTAH